MNKQPRKAKDLAQRTLINGLSAILIAFFIFLAEFKSLHWVFTVAIAAISAIAIWEYGQLLKKKELNPATYLSIIAAVIYTFMVFLMNQFKSTWPFAPEMVLAFAFLACFIHFAVTSQSPLLNISSTFFGLIYIAIPLGLFVRVMYFFPFKGSWWIIYLIATTKSADIGGYFVGSYFGKRKLAHRLSPNKTLEGAFGGLLAAIAISLFICFLGKSVGQTFKNFAYVQAVWLGALVAIVGQVGDLAESLLKRDAGVKDSNTIPGVGGILDMVDSLLFSAPLVYFFLRIIYA